MDTLSYDQKVYFVRGESSKGRIKLDLQIAAALDIYCNFAGEVPANKLTGIYLGLLF